MLVVSQADMRLTRFVFEMAVLARRGMFDDGWQLARLPVAEQLFHVVSQARPIHISRHAENRVAGR